MRKYLFNLATLLVISSAQAQTAPVPTAPPASTAAPANRTAQPTGTGGQTPAAAPQDTQNVPLDLRRSIELALSASSALAQARRTLESDRDRIEQVLAANRPNVTGTASATRFDAPTKISVGGGPPITALEEHTETVTLGLSQRVDVTGQIRAAASQARLQRLADEITVQSLTLSRTLQAKTAFYTLLRSENQVRVAEAALAAAQQQRDTARKLYEGQVGQKIDYLRAETTVAQAEQDLTAARNNRDIARASFNNIIGRPLEAPVATVAVSVPTDAAGEVGTVSGIRLSEATGEALRTRPEILNAEVQARIAETGIKLARVGQEPNLSVGASGNYYPTTSFQFPRQKTAALTATLTIPFYDGGLTRARVNEARARAENARTNLEGVRNDVSLDVQQAYLNLQTAVRQLSVTAVALQQARAARELAQTRYEGQVGLFLEVTDAQAALVRAETAQVNATYDYLTAQARFDAALGRSNTL
jgi:outer membrane protein TolC